MPKARTKHERTSLARQIEHTDAEIDRLVYALYGLSEEEIALVEGTKKKGGGRKGEGGRRRVTMAKRKQVALIPPERNEHAILLLRGQKVMIDADLAALYAVETKQLVRAVKRNSDRFPGDFDHGSRIRCRNGRIHETDVGQ